MFNSGIGAAAHRGFARKVGRLGRVAVASTLPALVALALASSVAPAAAASVARATLEAQLDGANPALAALHRHFPDRYAKMIDSLKDEDGASVVAFNRKVFPVITAVVSEHMAQIDDANAKETLSLLVAESSLLKDVSPESCIALLNGRAPAINIAAVLPPELGKRDLANTAAIIEQVARRPAAPAPAMTEQAAGKYALAALQRLTPEEQTLALPLLTQRQPETPAEMKAVCVYTLNFVSEVLNGPPGAARGMLAGR